MNQENVAPEDAEGSLRSVQMSLQWDRWKGMDNSWEIQAERQLWSAKITFPYGWLQKKLVNKFTKA